MVTLNIEDFGKYKNETVKKFTWTTSSDLSVVAISYGAIIQSIKVPDKYGVVKDIVLGFDDLDSYVIRNSPYLGAAIGRCANRIGGASFEIDGVTYKVERNAGQDHLHGGFLGFDKVNWQTTIDSTKVIFSYYSKDNDEGYPGDLVTNIIYEVKDDNTLSMEYIATTTKKTVVNLTNHSYFNLAGHDAGAANLYDHVVTINADKVTVTDANSIPTGETKSVGGTPYDLRRPIKLGEALAKNDELFDKNFCVNIYKSKEPVFVARVFHPSTGRSLEVHSDQPGVQFYTANYLPSPSAEALVGKRGVGYRRHGAFCLETQKYPNAINRKNFSTSLLKPGEVYRHRTLYTFGVEKSDPQVIAA
ncbi:hypothetical protein K1T71_011711 [Dendrolimus kikuchii]|uniref:Uncharacterized protein n=1 Tax=Dendrolimus kikuchii TaxID=765133 RepID=A0ACC1CM70_9NEOP|nr:hypothetical protein K1T71_011711 [Dendrolimus kikuchii]